MKKYIWYKIMHIPLLIYSLQICKIAYLKYFNHWEVSENILLNVVPNHKAALFTQYSITTYPNIFLGHCTKMKYFLLVICKFIFVSC